MSKTEVGGRQILTQAYPTAQIEEVEDGEEWTDKLRDYPCDMIISDLTRPDRGGYNALQAGASGYLGKDAAPEELLWAVRQILAGKKYIAIPRDN
jgi:two-component system, NarL family, invasion response regulator UvrY